ncbi:hypothetical protein [Phenylobacterium sp.]|uniref:hypothetical protein n=1 Tax=Phenylobacterium sp. TaxID=1871053 RepID=UPI0012216BE0|nr:hypothetical protein [Phenylobacterium sp.]THD61611.1 MAG: hypothetical protein E8A49_11615 [Phenylobacterium sp.]
MIDVDDPVRQTYTDLAILREMDAFLAGTERFPVRTVANTIFPQSTYEDHGAPDFFGVYLERIFPRLKRTPNDWGRYFERITAYPGPEGPINLLQILVAKMRRHIATGKPFRNIYELPIYNPVKDAEGSPRGGQCLSFLSFKLDADRRVLLSAVYRNHYYTEKLLGNLVGLGRLMQFVADEAGAAGVGPLTILSTHAEVDSAGASASALRTLFERCQKILSEEDAQVVI